jgi:hypothetical protein
MSLAYLWTLAHIHSSSPLHSQGLLLHWSLHRCALEHLEPEKCLIFWQYKS